MNARVAKTRILTAPHRRADDGPPPPEGLYAEPDQDILIVGEMLHDLRTMDELVRSLPFDRDHYHANLRIVLGAAVRTRQRCERLLEDSPLKKVEGAIDRLAERIVDQFEDTPAEASNKIDDPAGPSTIIDEPEPAEPPKRDPRGRSMAVPIEGGLKAAITRELRQGPKTSTELIEILTEDSGVRPDAIHEALAKMRTSKEVTSTPLGRKLINRLA